jgi:hypothetical protein
LEEIIFEIFNILENNISSVELAKVLTWYKDCRVVTHKRTTLQEDSNYGRLSKRKCIDLESQIGFRGCVFFLSTQMFDFTFVVAGPSFELMIFFTPPE